MQKFEMGQIVCTCGVDAAIEDKSELSLYIERHANGDWGDISPSTAVANDESINHEDDLERRETLYSEYKTKNGTRIWIITEWDRSVTTILLPSEH